MAKKDIAQLISDEVVINKIYFIRGHKVMLEDGTVGRIIRII